MVKEVVTKCNRCGSTEDVEEFTITRGGETREVDLCGEHKEPLIELYEIATTPAAVPAPAKRPAVRRGSTRHAVVPIEDWQQGN